MSTWFALALSCACSQVDSPAHLASAGASGAGTQQAAVQDDRADAAAEGRPTDTVQAQRAQPQSATDAAVIDDAMSGPADASTSGRGPAADAVGSGAQDAMVNASGAPPVTQVLGCHPIKQLDVLFVVDNSNSMATKQQALKEQFPSFIEALTTRRRPDAPGRSGIAVADLHVGVISTDMGIPGVDFMSAHCSADGGDDGKLQHVPHEDACASAYPTFLSFAAQPGDPAIGANAINFAKDLGCIATLGTGGCGYEQQLEAPLKALWPKVALDANGEPLDPNPLVFLATDPAHRSGWGDTPPEQGGNAGFLRNETDAEGPSLILIVVITDEEDCSVRDTYHLTPASDLPSDSPLREEDPNLRCYYHKEQLYDVQGRYHRNFRALRPGREELVMFAAIVGVPADLVSADKLEQVDFEADDPRSRDAFYDGILNDPRMQEQIDPSTNPGTGRGNLIPSCKQEATADLPATNAYPPRRIVELARAFGKDGMVQSICQDDLTPATTAIIDAVTRKVERPCAQP